jgi:hypothetical protein
VCAALPVYLRTRSCPHGFIQHANCLPLPLAFRHTTSVWGAQFAPAEWVRSYSSAEYLRLPAKAEALLDETGGTEDFGVFLFASPWLLLVCPILLTPAGQDGGAAG